MGWLGPEPLSIFQQLSSALQLGLIDFKCSSVLRGKTTTLINCFSSQGNKEAFRGSLRIREDRNSKPRKTVWASTAKAAAHTCQIPQPYWLSGPPVPCQVLQTSEGLAQSTAL